MRARAVGLARRVWRRREGATAVEFSLIIGPFILTLSAIAELAVMSLVQTNLDLAMAEMARQIRTGAVQAEGVSATDMRAAVCARVRAAMPLDCEASLFIEVERFEAFVELTAQDRLQRATAAVEEPAFDPGAPSDVILARGVYRWKIITPFFQKLVANEGDESRLFASSVLFRNEPFPEEDDGVS